MEQRKLRLGMVGGGLGAFIGAVHRIAARIDNRYELVAACLASTPEKARDSAQEIALPLERSYSSYKEMAEQESKRPDGIELVAIVTPNYMHFAMSKYFWEHGFHVICEKPMTFSLAEALEMHRLVRERPQQVYVLSHNYTGYPMVRQAREMISSGLIGAIRFVELKYIQGWFAQPVENKQAAWRTDPKRAGLGGALGDIATHAENLSSFITGLEMAELSAQLKAFVPKRSLDDNAQMMLRYKGGAAGQLWASQIAIGEENGLQIAVYGEQGSLKWQQEDPNYLIYADQETVQHRYTRNGAGASLSNTASSRIPAGHPEAYLESFAQIYWDTAELIQAKKEARNAADINLLESLLPSIDEGLAGLKFIQAAWDSNQNNAAWTKV